MKRKLFIIPAIALVGATAMASNSALAYGQNGLGRNLNSQKREHQMQMSQLIEDNDYEAFKDIVSGTRMADLVDNQYKFDQLVKAHDLRQRGDLEEAREIMESVGFIRGPTNERFCQR